MSARQILNKLSLYKDKSFINGIWKSSSVNKTFEVLSPPFDQEVIANVPDCTKEDIQEAIDGATTAFQTWRKTSCKERADLLRRLFEEMNANKAQLATIMSIENGKPYQEALVEIKLAASYLEWYSEQAKRMNGDMLPNAEGHIRRMILREPVGVCGMITPWNFPLAMITRKVGPALAAGCTAVLKPSEETPLSALAFCKLAENVGMPKGLLNVVTTSRENVALAGDMLCESADVRKITFTGSTAVGKILYQKAAVTMKKISMELGGNAPFIVFNSADVKLAAQQGSFSRYFNGGQSCVCAERFFVQEGVYDEFLEELKKNVAKLKSGNPLEEGTTFSSLINEGALKKVKAHIQDALDKGARLVMGGKLVKENTLFFEPTILTDCTMDMDCLKEETFGPIIPIVKFKNESEAIAMSNSTSSGLGGYFFSRDYTQVWRVAEQLEVGMVGCNDQAIRTEFVPFGGVKDSGIGREGSIYGLDDYTEMKYFHLALDKE